MKVSYFCFRLLLKNTVKMLILHKQSFQSPKIDSTAVGNIKENILFKVSNSVDD